MAQFILETIGAMDYDVHEVAFKTYYDHEEYSNCIEIVLKGHQTLIIEKCEAEMLCAFLTTFFNPPQNSITGGLQPDSVTGINQVSEPERVDSLKCGHENVSGCCFLAMFENGNQPFYLANWDGDPGRTLLKVNAKQFRTQALAEKAIKKAVQKYPQRNLVGKVVEYNAR